MMPAAALAAEQPRVLRGSHIDSVRHGGTFDGAAGVPAAPVSSRRGPGGRGTVHSPDLMAAAFAGWLRVAAAG